MISFTKTYQVFQQTKFRGDRSGQVVVLKFNLCDTGFDVTGDSRPLTFIRFAQKGIVAKKGQGGWAADIVHETFRPIVAASGKVHYR